NVRFDANFDLLNGTTGALIDTVNSDASTSCTAPDSPCSASESVVYTFTAAIANYAPGTFAIRVKPDTSACTACQFAAANSTYNLHIYKLGTTPYGITPTPTNTFTPTLTRTVTLTRPSTQP